ncbi:YeeE/YedE family protein [Zooshikella harenae]|uniref:YeeE/YedE family protein n=1 Tax=Zooshikella harenae TaxID=2827238 RepID=A0ABS5ZHB5_9GAMM|nr:YeeE/YedE family protein [Zooshikella harenae]MBU2712681.1 YeeE/YedE family protein [Zooshikella harenae]
MNKIVALCCGILFGIGLSVAQMVNPQKVLNFLDISGDWDPSLALVMVGALFVYALGYLLWVKPNNKPLLEEHFFLPTKKTIDKSLVVGSIIFGIGWGLSGICPGPALANLSGGDLKIVAFIGAMLVGMKCSPLLAQRIH